MRKNLVCLIIALFIGLSLNAQDKPLKWSEPMPMWPFDKSNTSITPFQPIGEQPFKQVDNVMYYNSPVGVFAVNPSFRVLPRANSWQSEVILVRHPLNPLIMFGSSNAINAVGSLFISEGVYVTTNGGVTWYGSDTLNGAPITNHGGDPGPTIDKNGRIIMTHLGYSTAGMYGNYSTDNGLTWSANATIQAGSVDKNFAGTDDCPTSPYYGRSYCVWTTWGGTYPDVISYTTNGGVSWSAPATMIPPTSGRICRELHSQEHKMHSR
ncbi:MAG: sialidase family protein [Ignavibacteriae bacterium]|nr:sialidase family protein [Ignavibacteriota bacterium]